MKNLILLFALMCSFFAFSQKNDIRKTLIVSNITSEFNTVLSNNSIVLDSSTARYYFLPNGASSKDYTLTDIVDKKLIGEFITDTITLDSSSIKYLYSSPVLLLDAPGVGYANLINSVVVDYDYVNAAYTGDSTLAIYYNGLANYAEAGNAIDGTSDKISLFVPVSTPILGKNVGLYLKAKTSNPVGATANGKIRIYVSYRIQRIY